MLHTNTQANLTYPPPFKPTLEINHIDTWIREWFDSNGPASDAVIGISGGKDSTIAAALLARALGPQRVIGILMPNMVQDDIADAQRVVELLKIQHMTVNVGPTLSALYASIIDGAARANIKFGLDLNVPLSKSTMLNTPPRMRMATLYAIAQSTPCGGLVCNTCNRSEDFIGYSTKYGDAAVDFAPLANYTVTEVLQMGDALGLPRDLVHKAPSDGLCGKTDEENLGFTYVVLDTYIMTGVCDDERIRASIDIMHRKNLHKLKPIPSCPKLS